MSKQWRGSIQPVMGLRGPVSMRDWQRPCGSGVQADSASMAMLAPLLLYTLLVLDGLLASASKFLLHGRAPCTAAPAQLTVHAAASAHAARSAGSEGQGQARCRQAVGRGQLLCLRTSSWQNPHPGRQNLPGSQLGL